LKDLKPNFRIKTASSAYMSGMADTTETKAKMIHLRQLIETTWPNKKRYWNPPESRKYSSLGGICNESMEMKIGEYRMKMV
jgi:hypothetical protein